MDTVRSSLLTALLVCMASGAAAQSISPEYQVKAVFLLHFTQFIEWPSDAFGNAEAPFVIGVLGKDPFGAKLDEVVRGEHVAQHRLVVERYQNVAEVRRCNLLFIPGGDNRLESVVAAVKGHRILTVSDADEKELRGVMIRLVMRNSRVRMQIDVDAAKADNLTISSNLLRPAELVDRDKRLGG
jgi:hypothetical protein